MQVQFLYKCLILAIFLVQTLGSYAQFKTSEASVKIRIEDDWSDKKAREIARARAIVAAIESAYGTNVLQLNSVAIRNAIEAGDIKSVSMFNMIATSYVNGDLAKVLEERPGEREKDSRGDWYMSYYVKVKVKERKKLKYEIKTLTLDNVDKEAEENDFKAGRKLYIYFKSAVSGYLSIYLEEENHQEFSRLLPYLDMQKVYNIEIEEDKEHIFFAPNKNNYLEDDSYIHEFELDCDGQLEINNLILIFSKDEEHNKPLLGPSNRELSKENQEAGYRLPPAAQRKDFYNWMAKVMKSDDLQVEYISITIHK